MLSPVFLWHPGQQEEVEIQDVLTSLIVHDVDGKNVTTNCSEFVPGRRGGERKAAVRDLHRR